MHIWCIESAEICRNIMWYHIWRIFNYIIFDGYLMVKILRKCYLAMSKVGRKRKSALKLQLDENFKSKVGLLLDKKSSETQYFDTHQFYFECWQTCKVSIFYPNAGLLTSFRNLVFDVIQTNWPANLLLYLYLFLYLSICVFLLYFICIVYVFF